MDRGLWLALGVSLVLACGCSQAPSSPPRTGLCYLAVGDAPVRGPMDAWVTMVEFSDFQCPYCGAAEPTVRALLTEYSTDLRLVYRHFPLSRHVNALPAAIAAWCAGEQDQFWEMHNLLFANQSALASSELALYATTLGLDMTAWQACVAGDAAPAAVAADVALGNAAGIGGTPSFFINGEYVVGAQPQGYFESVIDAALATAQASGLTQATFYDQSVTTVGCP